MMQSLGRRDVRTFSAHHRRSGTLWEGRFKSCLVDSERYLMTCIRYIELNPVRAAMVARAEDYRWSSVHAHLGLAFYQLLTPHASYQALDVSPELRVAAYRCWLQAGVGEDELSAIRAHMQQERALGSPRFQAMVESALGRPVMLRPPGRPRRRRGGEDSNASVQSH